MPKIDWSTTEKALKRWEDAIENAQTDKDVKKADDTYFDEMEELDELAESTVETNVS